MGYGSGHAFSQDEAKELAVFFCNAGVGGFFQAASQIESGHVSGRFFVMADVVVVPCLTDDIFYGFIVFFVQGP